MGGGKEELMGLLSQRVKNERMRRFFHLQPSSLPIAPPPACPVLMLFQDIKACLFSFPLVAAGPNCFKETSEVLERSPLGSLAG